MHSAAVPASVATAALAPVIDSSLSKRPYLVRVEYAVYIAVAAGLNVLALRRMYDHSYDPRSLALSKHQLSPPWFFPGTFSGVDLSDTQLASFLQNLPLLSVVLAIYVGISRFVRNAAPSLHVPTQLALNSLVLYYMHGPTCIFMLVLYGINYGWTKMHDRVPFAAYYGLAWIFHVAILFSNDIHKGYKFEHFHPALRWLDEGGTGIMRWHVVFNMSTLRMLGYNYDVWEAHRNGDAVRVEQEAKHARTCVDCAETRAPCHRLRTAVPRPLAEYGLVNYLAYITYVPLYIGGPLTSFNAFMSHIHVPQKAFDLPKAARYFGRATNAFFLMILFLHIAHMSTLRRDDDAFARMTIGDKCYYGILFLAFLWLKFNMIWKFFRLVGIADGIESPEDMQRCFSNTTTVGGFWRDWHASFNQWIVRYMYVPMGGSKVKVIGIFPIFIFIAIWHDIELHLLWWAGIMCLAFIPELVVGGWFNKNCKWMQPKPYYRHVCAIGGACSGMSLIIANMFGYGTGMSSAKGVEDLTGSLVALAAIAVYLFSTNNISIYERVLRSEDEQRRKLACGLVKGY